MANDSYYVIKAPAHGEYEEKKSRFLGDVFPVKDIQEALTCLASVKKTHYDARHHCYAYIIGDRKEQVKSSDNGEPSGTAGKPILEVLQGTGVTNVILIVTRYFGGTLLGTGGLVRAYTKAAQAAIGNAEVVPMVYSYVLTLRYPYHLVTPVERYLSSSGLSLTNQDYAADVTATITVPADDVARIEKGLTDLSSGAITVRRGEEGYFPG